MLVELIHNAMHSSVQGFFGVSFIFVYFIVIVSVAIYRIQKGEHLSH